jgi:hypothetical protein
MAPTYKIEAEAIAQHSGFSPEAISAASGRQTLSLKRSTSSSGTVSFQFTGISGSYDVYLGTFDENDGIASFSISRNGNTIGSVRLDQNLGSAAPNATTTVRPKILNRTQINNGDVIVIKGSKNGTEFARLDFLEFVGVQNTTPAPTPTPSPTVNLPGLSGEISPSGPPPLPGGSDIFNPSFNGSVGVQAPIISEWTKTAQPGDTIVLTGWKFSQLTGSQMGTDTKFWVYGQTQSGNNVLAEAKIQKLSGDVASITLPTSLPQGGTYIVWAQNGTGASRPVLVNETEAWWVGPDAATRGQITSIFGRNLSQDGGTARTNVYFEDSQGRGTWAEVVSVNPYKVDIRVPAGLANGIYRVWIHNGDGGQYGWSDPLTLAINDGINYTGPTINVRNYGARGDGSTDDTQAIFNAITAASRSPMSTVYFPSGTYVLGRTIYGWWGFGKDDIRFQGAGKNATVIKAANNFNGPFMYQVAPGNRLTFLDLTLDSNRQPLYQILKIRGSNDVQLLNISLNGQGSGQMNPFDIHASTRVFIHNSDFTGIQSFLGTTSQVFIDRVNFYGSDYGGSLLAGFGTKKLSITNSVGRNLDNSDPNNTKWVAGRLWVEQDHWSNSQYQYFGNNQTIDLAVPNARGIDQNAGEQILWETLAGKPMGSVVSSTDSSVRFSSVADIEGSYFLTITAGTGIGQTRQVKSLDVSKQTVSIDETWNVRPDVTSVIVAKRTPSKIAVYNNVLDGMSDYANRYTASTGVQT